MPSYFKGYFPTYSAISRQRKNYFTWAILKAHTQNTAGRVTLRSADPRDVPEINFHYFDESNDTEQQDLESVVEGIEFVRFGGEDVVRHKLVQRIVAAYNEYAEKQAPDLRAQRRQQAT